MPVSLLVGLFLNCFNFVLCFSVFFWPFNGLLEHFLKKFLRINYSIYSVFQCTSLYSCFSGLLQVLHLHNLAVYWCHHFTCLNEVWKCYFPLHLICPSCLKCNFLRSSSVYTYNPIRLCINFCSNHQN